MSPSNESVLALMESLLADFSIGGHIRERSGSTLPGIAPSNLYPTCDQQWLVLDANHDSIFRRLAGAMGQPSLAEDARFATHRARGENATVLDEIISRWTSTLDADAALDVLLAHDIPSSRIYCAPEMLDDEHFRARGAIRWDDHGRMGLLPMPNVVPRLSKTPGHVVSTGPELGEHTVAVLQQLAGLSVEEVHRLASDGIVGVHHDEARPCARRRWPVSRPAGESGDGGVLRCAPGVRMVASCPGTRVTECLR